MRMLTAVWSSLHLFAILTSVGAAPTKQKPAESYPPDFDDNTRLAELLAAKAGQFFELNAGAPASRPGYVTDFTKEFMLQFDSILHDVLSELQTSWHDLESEQYFLDQSNGAVYKMSSLQNNMETFFKALVEKMTSKVRKVRDPISDLATGALSCGACQLVVSLAQTLMESNRTEDDIKASLFELCSTLKVETPRVCKGIIDEFAPEILTVLEQLVLTPDEICGTLFDDCGVPYNPKNDWNITFPPTPQPPPVHPVLPKPDSPTLRFLHLTDVHYDPEYRVGSSAKCGEPLCCRGDTLADGTDGAWKFGDYRNCDVPLWTLENLFSTLAAQNDTFDYIIWTGDVPAHNVWNQSRDDQIKVISAVINLLVKHFPGKPVYPSLGNHESAPVNSFPPPYITGDKSISWLYDALVDGWKHWLPQDALDSVKRGAYYTVNPYPGFRIISLNMNYCNNQNWWMILNTTDPAGELQWLIATLQKAEDTGEKVHILGHIPPGNGDCLKTWSWNYYKIVSRYQNTITGQFFGHTHKDHFELFYDIETLQTPISVAYIAPSVTSFSNLNMGYRFYTMDGAYKNSSYQVLDHETFYMNLTKANIEDKITWEFEYSARSTYNLPSLFPRDWDNLINRMKTNDTLLQTFNKYLTKSIGSGACDADCRKALLCQARSARSQDPSLCKDIIKREQDFYDMLHRESKHC